MRQYQRPDGFICWSLAVILLVGLSVYLIFQYTPDPSTVKEMIDAELVVIGLTIAMDVGHFIRSYRRS